MPKQGKTRRIAADAQRHMEAAAGDCIAWLAPPLGILMRCRVPCVRCAELEREWQAMLPGIEAERAERRAREQAAASIDYAAVENADTFSPQWREIISKAERLLKTDQTNATLAAEILKLAKRAGGHLG
jgi:hypothetical protein